MAEGFIMAREENLRDLEEDFKKKALFIAQKAEEEKLYQSAGMILKKLGEERRVKSVAEKAEKEGKLYVAGLLYAEVDKKKAESLATQLGEEGYFELAADIFHLLGEEEKIKGLPREGKKKEVFVLEGEETELEKIEKRKKRLEEAEKLSREGKHIQAAKIFEEEGFYKRAERERDKALLRARMIEEKIIKEIDKSK